MQPESNLDSKKKNSKAKKSPVDSKRWGTTVRVSWDTYRFIVQHGEFQESFDQVLKKLLKL